MNKNVKILTTLLVFSLLTACGSSSKSNSSLSSEDRNSYSDSDFLFSDENGSEINSATESYAAESVPVFTSAHIKSETVITTTKKQTGMVINSNKNKVLYLRLDQKTKLDDGYSFSYSIDNTTSDKMTFTVTSVKCDETDITDVSDLSLIEIEGLQSACGEFTAASPLLNESSEIHIIGDWTNEAGAQIFTDFRYTFNMDLISTY